MDIGNLPIFGGNKSTTKSRSNDEADKAPSKNAWDQIGDYNDQGPATVSDDSEDNEDKEQAETVAKTPTKEERQKSDDAASIASEAAVKGQKDQSKK